jgi:hypothetical protein
MLDKILKIIVESWKLKKFQEKRYIVVNRVLRRWRAKFVSRLAVVADLGFRIVKSPKILKVIGRLMQNGGSTQQYTACQKRHIL